MKIIFNNTSYKITQYQKSKSFVNFRSNFQNVLPDESNQSTWEEVYRTSSKLPWSNSNWIETSLEAINPYLLEKTDLKILDYGCGTGEISKYLHSLGHQVTACDISDTVVENIKKQNLGFNVICAEHPNKIDIKDFDCIICWCVLHHINPKNWESFLSTFSQKLKKDGNLIISGFDKSDLKFTELQKPAANVTKNKIWPINDIADNKFLSKFNFILKDTRMFFHHENCFNEKRNIRYFLLKKNSYLVNKY